MSNAANRVQRLAEIAAEWAELDRRIRTQLHSLRLRPTLFHLATLSTDDRDNLLSDQEIDATLLERNIGRRSNLAREYAALLEETK